MKGVDHQTTTVSQLHEKYGLDKDSSAYREHALALHRDDNCLQRPCGELIWRIKLYSESLAYSIGELPQGFARLSAISGGTCKLDKPIDAIVMDSD
ncbi:hypothetical protein V5799_004609 [Amblyomma americanum]|uniref:Uncharacterized protein n=1 Tax=Amblyomma americanum TaxID=6943 RepID=A0AAQ4D5M0_AMBAM